MPGLLDHPGPLVFAHRGASACAPENTLAAFRMAAEMGADGIELDTKLTSDGVVVVMHDQSVDRTTNGRGSIASFSAAGLFRLDAGSRFSPAFRGEPVPTLEAVFKAVGKRVLINVELTNYASPFDALPVRVAELIRQHGLAERVIISSFHPVNLIRFRRLMPAVPLGFLTQEGKSGRWARSWVGSFIPQNALHPYFTDVDGRLVNRCHQHGKKVNVWTVDQREEVRRLLALGVDGIITNDPQAVKSWL